MVDYLTKNEFAQKQGYASWTAYAAANTDYVTSDALDDMIEEMTALMNEEIGVTTNVTATGTRATLLRNICYRGVMMMIDDEQARGQEAKRSIFQPRDYMYERDRDRLRSIGLRSGARKRAKWVF